MNVILFNRTFSESERISDLDTKLEQEKAGIFNWAMLGLFRLRKRGSFIVPEQSAKWLEQYELSNDTERTFLLEMCDFDPATKVQSQELYNAFNSWCRDNGNTPKSSQMVASDWRRLGLHDTRMNGRTFWHGVRLRKPL
jgi:putative DNA primase/helicase